MSTLPPEKVMKEIAASQAPQPAPAAKKNRKIALGAAGGLVVLLAIGAYLIYLSRHETTDDAYTTGHVHDISSRVAGTVVEVAVDDNEFVKKGQVLAPARPARFSGAGRQGPRRFRARQGRL